MAVKDEGEACSSGDQCSAIHDCLDGTCQAAHALANGAASNDPRLCLSGATHGGVCKQADGMKYGGTNLDSDYKCSADSSAGSRCIATNSGDDLTVNSGFLHTLFPVGTNDVHEC